MDTLEARTSMLGLAERALHLIREFQAGQYVPVAAQQSIRGLLNEARPLIGDAGYPGEGIWTALNHMDLGFSAYAEPFDSPYWVDVQEEMLAAAHTLDALLGGPAARDLDFRIVG